VAGDLQRDSAAAEQILLVHPQAVKVCICRHVAGEPLLHQFMLADVTALDTVWHVQAQTSCRMGVLSLAAAQGGEGNWQHTMQLHAPTVLADSIK
jgi:hypothetical protein